MIKKGVILAAGKGSRMGPITNAIPKPMLPLLDKPILEYIVDEAKESGLTELFLVVGHQAHVIESYFEEEENLFFIKQHEPLGNAHALYQVKNFLQDEPFALFYADEIIQSKESLIRKLIKTYEKYPDTFVSGLEKSTSEKIKVYNQVHLSNQLENDVYEISSIEEKPSVVTSHYTSFGRYVLSPDIFEVIPMTKKRHGEYYLSDTFQISIKSKRFLGVTFEGMRFDIGSKKGWLETNLLFAKNHPEFA